MISRAIWNGDGDRSIFSAVTTDDSAWLTNHRLGFETVTDVHVRGVSGFTRTIAGDPGYLRVVWRADGLTYILGSRGFTEAGLSAVIEQMRPATQGEWDAMQAAAPTPDVMTEELSTTIEAP